ncbi:hypothetical protein HGRIS_005458 [Hohenbuehelia grisea]|uniref:Uncharacterized protein n=1 Tax=Hohenbuehelia grisea TaxID=104357 RepID=A0ABR3JZ79_9AGAR
MKLFAISLALFAGLATSGLVSSQIISPQLTVNSTIEIAGTSQSLGDAVSVGKIKGTTLARKGNFPCAQAGIWSNGSVAFGSALTSGTTTSLFQDFKVPNGVTINLPLLVLTLPRIDSDTWFTVDTSSPCIANFTASGNFMKYTYTFNGLTC